MDADQRWMLLRLNVEEEIPLAELARTSGIGLRTLQRWKANFHAHGYTGLSREARRDQGMHRIDEALIKQIEDLGLARPRASIATIHRVVTSIAQEQGLRPPSYSTVRNIITALDPGLRTVAYVRSASAAGKHKTKIAADLHVSTRLIYDVLAGNGSYATRPSLRRPALAHGEEVPLPLPEE